MLVYFTAGVPRVLPPGGRVGGRRRGLREAKQPVVVEPGVGEGQTPDLKEREAGNRGTPCSGGSGNRWSWLCPALTVKLWVRPLPSTSASSARCQSTMCPHQPHTVTGGGEGSSRWLDWPWAWRGLQGSRIRLNPACPPPPTPRAPSSPQAPRRTRRTRAAAERTWAGSSSASATTSRSPRSP